MALGRKWDLAEASDAQVIVKRSTTRKVEKNLAIFIN
jgi:hypothetical protein